MIAYLFDIDGTLVRAGGAGARALTATLLARFGLGELPRGVAFDGRTDGWIVRELVVRGLGRAPAPGEVDAILADYLGRLDDALAGSVQVLPDADRVLTWLGARPEVRLGLATGNIAAGARAKLTHAGLAHHFGFGGYGCDSIDRAELVAVAIARSGIGPADTAVVVGDTVHDVAAARACGARCVAVTTGGDDHATLAAAGADVVLDGLGPLVDWHAATFGA
ncbi:MAG: HAD family hydrolase [Myxococcales bacterium]|nr:HAD family hydrolase [Myxococcales bacterium]